MRERLYLSARKKTILVVSLSQLRVIALNCDFQTCWDKTKIQRSDDILLVSNVCHLDYRLFGSLVEDPRTSCLV